MQMLGRSFSPLTILPTLFLLLSLTNATTFTIINKCSYTIWPAALPGGGGREVTPNTNWMLTKAAVASTGRFWARTQCSFDAVGKGSCLTGDCGGILNCTENGTSPATLVEYSLYQYGDNDFYEISLVDGYNVPVELGPADSKAGNCSSVRCSADIEDECPAELRVNGGCKSGCDVFKTNEYCCNTHSGSRGEECGATKYSNFFKRSCPQAYTHPQDDATSTFTCPSGGDYIITFCP